MKLFSLFINGMGSPVRWGAPHSWECLSRAMRVLERGEIELDDPKSHHHAEIYPCEMIHSTASFSHPQSNPAYERFFSPHIEIIGSTNLIILPEDEIFADFFQHISFSPSKHSQT